MRIVISGGSNSLRREGWVKHFAEHIQGIGRVQNISVGAASSVMGLYRTKECDLGPGDVLIWEYALNDANYIDQRGYDEGFLLRCCEHGIRECIDRGAYFLPAIFRPFSRERLRDQPDTYRRGLKALFRRYGIAFLDVSKAFKARQGLRRIQRLHYDDDKHYAQDGPIVRFVATRLARMIRGGLAAPAPASGLRGSSAALHAVFDTGAPVRFSNNALSVNMWAEVNGELSMPPFAEAGRLLAVAMIAHPLGGAKTLTIGDRTLTISATQRERNYAKPLLKCVAIPMMAQGDMAFGVGDRLRIASTRDVETLRADFGFAKRPSDAALKAQKARIVGVLVETQGQETDDRLPCSVPSARPLSRPVHRLGHPQCPSDQGIR